MKTVFQIAFCVIFCALGFIKHVETHGDGDINELIKRIDVLEASDVEQRQIELQYQEELDAQRRAIATLQAENADQQRHIKELTDGINESAHHPYSRHAPGRTVAFFSKLAKASPAHLDPNDTILFEVADTNVGGAYDPTRGFFTAPVPGVYVFSITITTFSIFNTDCGFAKNGVRVTEVWINGKHNAFASNGQTVLLHLDAGDVISVQQAGAESYLEGSGHSLFTGFLLFEDSLGHAKK